MDFLKQSFRGKASLGKVFCYWGAGHAVIWVWILLIADFLGKQLLNYPFYVECLTFLWVRIYFPLHLLLIGLNAKNSTLGKEYLTWLVRLLCLVVFLIYLIAFYFTREGDLLLTEIVSNVAFSKTR